jgi:3-oxoacyl-[acyl-carrier-protein] synthase III
VAMCDALNAQKVKPGDKVLLAGAAAGFSAGYIGLVV